MKTSRKKLIDRDTNVRDAKLCVIATEGEKTEKQYFALFQNPRIKVEVLSTAGGLSAPNHVLERLDQFKARYNLGPEDSLWLMFDVDRNRAEKLSDICQEATQKGFQLAISNPCFEFWLFLHHFNAEDFADCKAIEAELKARLGSYNKTNLRTELYRPLIMDALRRAKSLHTNPAERWPEPFGTHVYKVIETLL